MSQQDCRDNRSATGGDADPGDEDDGGRLTAAIGAMFNRAQLDAEAYLRAGGDLVAGINAEIERIYQHVTARGAQ